MATGRTSMAGDRPGFGIGKALAVSVVLHVVLFVLGWLLPTPARTQPPIVEETVLRFDLIPTDPSTESIEPRGDVPIPMPQPLTTPVPTFDEFVADPSPADLPPPPEERRELVPEEIVDPAVRSEVSAEMARSGLDLPGEGIESSGERESSRPSPATAPPPRRFDMESALRDFGRAMRRPQPDADGSRRGLNIPDLPPLPATGFGFGNLEFESRDFDWSDYARQIYMAIWRAWHNRLYVTADEFERWGYASRDWTLRHATRIVFTIQKNGQVTGIAVETPSGCYPLDDSAVDALTEVILPPLPADFPRGGERVHARFIADGDVRTMRRYLGWLKREGHF